MASTDRLDALPGSLREPFRAVTRLLGEAPRLDETPEDGYRHGRTSAHAVYLAGSPAGRARVALETRRLRWAAEQGLPVPPVAHADPGGRWLVTGLVPADPPEGTAYVDAAVEAARAVERAEAPPEVLEGTSGRRAPRRGRVRRLLRLLAGGVPVVEFLRLRRRAAALPADALGHGDFHPRNVLFDAERGAVHLTDLEFLEPAPSGSDLLLLWCTLSRDADRRHLEGRLLEGASVDERRRLGLLHRWIVLRTLAEVAAASRESREPGRLAELRRLVRVARRNARVWSR